MYAKNGKKQRHRGRSFLTTESLYRKYRFETLSLALFEKQIAPSSRTRHL